MRPGSSQPPQGGSTLTRLPLPLAAIVVALLLAGCGSGDDGEGEAGGKGAGTSTSAGKGAPPGKAPAPKPFGPPPTKESLGEAQKRIETVIDSGDCEKINGLNALSRPTLATDERCEYLKRISGYEVTGAESYDDLAAVIDYTIADRIYTAVLLRDADGLFHITVVDPFRSSETVGTKPGGEFDKAADATVQAFRDGDCDAYLEVVSRLSGPGSTLSDGELCDLFDNNPIVGALETFPKTKLESIGGNSQFGFYGLDFPSGYVVLLFGRTPSTLPDGLPEELTDVPKDAPEVGYLAFYRTNFDQPQGDAG